MKQTDPQFKLRLPPALKQELDVQATSHERTLGAEIVARLQASLVAQNAPSSAVPVQTVVSIRWGSEGEFVNVALSEAFLDAVVRPAVVDVVRAGLDRWRAEQSGEVFKADDRTELQLVVKKRA